MLQRLFILPLFLASAVAFAQMKESAWVDSVLKSMPDEEKIAQLMMIRVDGAQDLEPAMELVKEYGVGGIVVSNASLTKQVNGINALQQVSRVPLFVAMESGLGMIPGIDSVQSFPSTLLWRAAGNDSLSFEIGRQIGERLQETGTNLNFLPLDANMTSGMNAHSISPTAFKVFESTVESFCLGLRSEHILNSLMYSPAALSVARNQHGVPNVSSLTDSLETILIRKLTKEGIRGVTPTANELPLLFGKRSKEVRNKFSSDYLSLFTGDKIKKEFDFANGLVFASIPQARLSKQSKAGGVEANAFKAGNDILLGPDVSAGIRSIKKAIKKNPQLHSQLDERVRKVLELKYNNGLLPNKPVSTDNLFDRLNNNPRTEIVRNEIFEQAATIVKNDSALLPIRNLDTRTFAVVSTGSANNTFAQYLNNYDQVDTFGLATTPEAALVAQLKTHDVIFVALLSDSAAEQQRIGHLMELLQGSHLVLCDFTASANTDLYHASQASVAGYTSDEEMQRVVPEIIFGALPARGHLPFRISQDLTAGTGISSQPLQRLGYGTPESVGMSSKVLEHIKEIALEAIDSGATPGCYIIVARKGKIIYDQGFGYQTYEKKIPVDSHTIYDLASLTKVSSTLQAFMFLYEKGYFDLDKKVSVYLPELKGTNKENLVLRDVLTHQAGLIPFLPFWKDTMAGDTTLMPKYYSHTKSASFPLTVAKGLYTLPGMPDSLWQWTIRSPLEPQVGRQPYHYLYSDMSFYTVYHLCERYLNQPVSDFVTQNVYEPLGASSMGFLPLTRFSPSRIAPTERDTLWRKELLIGTVHDQGAALAGGIAGHAGLFGCAYDMAKLGQMLLQKGTYGGLRFYKPETVDMFTAQQFKQSQRGLGWNKPVQSSWITATSEYASPLTFGHTGFTGTCLWVDPEFDLVYVFLSNRVHPIMTNNKLIKMNIRSRIQDTIYESIFEYSRDPLIY